MTATKTLIHEYRSYGTADGCAACIAARADLAAMDRLVLDEVERVGWMRSEDEIHDAILRKDRDYQESPRLSVLAALDRLAEAEMIERCEDDRPLVPTPGRGIYVRLDGDLYGHQPTWGAERCSDLSVADVAAAADEAWSGLPRDAPRAARLWHFAGELAGDKGLIESAIALQRAERELNAEGVANSLVHALWSFSMASSDEMEESNRALETAKQAMAAAGHVSAEASRALSDPRGPCQ